MEKKTKNLLLDYLLSTDSDPSHLPNTCCFGIFYSLIQDPHHLLVPSSPLSENRSRWQVEPCALIWTQMESRASSHWHKVENRCQSIPGGGAPSLSSHHCNQTPLSHTSLPSPLLICLTSPELLTSLSYFILASFLGVGWYYFPDVLKAIKNIIALKLPQMSSHIQKYGVGICVTFRQVCERLSSSVNI